MNQGHILPFAEFCISGGGGGGGAAAASSSTRKTDNTKIFWHPVHNPRPQRREGRKLVRDVKGDETSRVAGKDLKDAHVVQRDRDGGGLVRDKAEIVQEPLKDLPPEQNSPKKVVRERQQQHGLGKRMPFVDDDDNDDDDDDGDECLVQKKESENPTIRQQDEDHGFQIVGHPEMLDERKEGAEAEDDEEDTLAVVENSILHIGDNDNSADELVPMPTMPSDSPFVSIKETNNNNNITQSKRKEKEKESASPLTTTTTATTTSTQKQARLHRDISDILTNHLKRTTTTTSTDSVSDVAESPTETSMPTSVTAQQHPRKHRPLGRAPSNPTSLLIRNSTTASNDSTSSSHRAAHTSTSTFTSATHPNPIPGGHVVEIDEIDALLHAQHCRHIDTSAEVFRPSQALSYEDPEAVKLKQGVWRQLGMTGLDGVVEGEDEGRVVGIGVVRDRVRERGDAAAGGGGGGRSMRSRTGRKGKGG